MYKRVFDFLLATVGLIVVFPCIVIFPILIKLTSKGPAFFVQKRIGINGKPFNMLKFRSMVLDAREKGPYLTTRNDPRITTFGRFLRKTKLDEIPQLINVFKGDMSIVGPRPELPRYVEMFREDYQTILKVKPGITDIASIMFSEESKILRSPDTCENDYIEKVMPVKIGQYKKYVYSQSLKQDIQIVLRTISMLLKL